MLSRRTLYLITFLAAPLVWAEEGLMIEAIEVTPGSPERQIEVALGSCGKTECPIEARLRIRDKVVTILPLPVTAAPGSRVSAFTDNAGRKLWNTSPRGRDGYAVLRLQPIHLSPAEQALLTTQRTSSDQLTFAHALYAVQANQLEKVWSADTSTVLPSGLTWLRVEDLDHDGTDELIHVESIDHYRTTPDESDRWSARALRWDPGKREMRPESRLPPVYMLLIAEADTVVEARLLRDALQGSGGCADLFWVLPSKDFPRLGQKKKFLLAYPTLDDDRAHRRAVQVTACNPAIKLSHVQAQ